MTIALIEPALGQDPRLERYHLLPPHQRLDLRTGIDPTSNRYRLLGPNQVFGRPDEPARYYLLDRQHLRYLEEHRHMFDNTMQEMLERVKARKYLDAQVDADIKSLKLMTKALGPRPVGVALSMLDFLNMSIDQYNKLTEQERERQFCRYRIAIYRRDGIMYPKECSLRGLQSH